MKTISDLTEILKAFLPGDKGRVDCFAQMVMALITLNTINLVKLSQVVLRKAQIGASSRYRRMQRFFHEVRIDFNQVARFLFRLFFSSTDTYYLILDRTCWECGQRSINILFLCLSYKGLVIPLFWLPLKTQGNSDTRERIALLKRFIQWFGKSNIQAVLADREFIGEDWLAYLLQEEIPFYICIKKDANTVNARGKSVKVGWLFYDLKAGEHRLLKGQRPIYGHALWIWGSRSPVNGEFMIVATAKPQENGIENYLNRWPIETLFGCLKGRGFRLEDTRILQRRKIKKVIAFLALSYAWAIKIGLWRHRYEKVIRLKKHGRKAISFFRYGLDFLQDAAFKLMRRLLRSFVKAVNILCPPATKPLSALHYGAVK